MNLELVIKMIRKLYIAYRKDRKHDAFIENVVDYLLKNQINLRDF